MGQAESLLPKQIRQYHLTFVRTVQLTSSVRWQGNIAFSNEFARRFGDRGITCNAVNPGE